MSNWPRGLTYTRNFSGLITVQKLTKAHADQLARRARQYGHQRVGFEGGAQKVMVRCPLCRETVYGYYAPRGLAGPRTSAQGLDRGMMEHLAEDCIRVHGRLPFS